MLFRSQQLFPNHLPSIASKLPARLLLQFIHGREFLRHAGWQIVCHILLPILRDALSCDTYNQCSNCLQVLWQQKLSTFATDDVSFADDPLKTLRDLCGLVSATGDSGICLQCKVDIVQALEATRRYIWEGLPIYFEIDKSGPREKSIYELTQNLRSVSSLCMPSADVVHSADSFTSAHLTLDLKYSRIVQ